MGIRKRRMVVMLMCASMATPIVFAETPAEELTRISEATAVLKARQTQLEAEQKVLEIEQNIRKLKESGGGNIEQPVLKGIEGVDGKMVATFTYGSDVAEMTAHKGETIRGGWTIIQITNLSVFLRRGKEELRLNRSGEGTKTSGAGVSRSSGATQGGGIIGLPTGR